MDNLDYRARSLWPVNVLELEHSDREHNAALCAVLDTVVDAHGMAPGGSGVAYKLHRKRYNLYTDYAGPPVDWLRERVVADARMYLRHFYGWDEDFAFDLVGFVNKYTDNARIPEHTHVGAHLIHIYYPRVDVTSDRPSDAGQLVLTDPRARNRDWYPVGHTSEFPFDFLTPHTGKAIVIQGFVMHSSLPYLGGGARMCVSTNIVVKAPSTFERPFLVPSQSGWEITS